MQKKFESQTVEYGTWVRMIARCYDESSVDYPRWGGRGIEVCDRWRHSYQNFLSDMGRRPKNKNSLDRIDNSKGYSPENCRWSTYKEQANNTRRNIKATIDGQTKSVSEWCEIYGLRPSSVFDRINKRGWTPEEAITRPFLKYRQVKIDGEIKTVSQWSKYFGIHPQSVNKCIRKGMTPEEAIFHIKENSWTKKEKL